MYNATKLFHQASPLPSLRKELVLRPDQKAKLKAARDLIRRTLKEVLVKASSLVPANDYYDPGYIEKARVRPASDQVLRPRFRSQGSWVYDTLNRPAQSAQEMDLDDGMYVPMSVVEGRPAVASTALRRMVEMTLAALCQAQGWRLDTEPNICLRVVIDFESHIDINIYAIPDDQMHLVEKRASASFADSAITANAAPQEIHLDSDQIYVSHKTKGWEQSDPLELENWFRDAVDRHSRWTNVARIVRYLKAWRDWKWTTSKLSSLVLMVCAVKALDEANTPPRPNRDDDGLLVVARALPGMLADTVYNPVLPDVPLTNWDVTQRNTYELAARGLREELAYALEREGSAQGVLGRIQKLWGQRVPNDVSLISAVSVIGQVRDTPAKQSPSPKVGTHTSG